MCLAVAVASSHVIKSLTKLAWRQSGSMGLDTSTSSLILKNDVFTEDQDQRHYTVVMSCANEIIMNMIFHIECGT